MMKALTEIEIDALKVFKRGKVRTVYDLGDNLLIVASDRISAFDYILPDGIPDKGKILTRISGFWFRKLSHISSNHLISDCVDDFPEILKPYSELLRDRSMLVRKAHRIDIECIVRGYLSGSAWREYQATGKVAGSKLREGLQKDAELETPIFTPSTKTEEGHDRNITIDEMRSIVGDEATEEIVARSIRLFEEARKIANQCGLTLVDTKFEFGYANGDLILIDEVLTPDSSRYWFFEDGRRINLDKQYVRDYLEQSGWDKNSPPPNLPDHVVLEVRRRYVLLANLLMGVGPGEQD